jgi:hypothetical protein
MCACVPTVAPIAGFAGRIEGRRCSVFSTFLENVDQHF